MSEPHLREAPGKHLAHRGRHEYLGPRLDALVSLLQQRNLISHPALRADNERRINEWIEKAETTSPRVEPGSGYGPKKAG
jgi:hypothetical protein